MRVTSRRYLCSPSSRSLWNTDDSNSVTLCRYIVLMFEKTRFHLSNKDWRYLAFAISSIQNALNGSTVQYSSLPDEGNTRSPCLLQAVQRLLVPPGSRFWFGFVLNDWECNVIVYFGVTDVFRRQLTILLSYNILVIDTISR